MATFRRAKHGNGYFFTVAAYRRRPILCNPDIRTALRETIIQTRQHHPFIINAWVLLPDHLHTIWTLPENDTDYSIRWALIKRKVSQRCDRQYTPAAKTASHTNKREASIWQRRFWEHSICDEADFSTHMDDIHFNPLKHGLVTRVSDWPYSSFHRCQNQGIYPHDWCGNGQIADEMHFGEP
jgi:putative transposase